MSNKPDSTVTESRTILDTPNKGVTSVLNAQWHNERVRIKPRKTTFIPYPEASNHKQFEQKITAELEDLGLHQADHAQGLAAPGYSINPGDIGLLIHVSKAEFEEKIEPKLTVEQDEKMPLQKNQEKSGNTR